MGANSQQPESKSRRSLMLGLGGGVIVAVLAVAILAGQRSSPEPTTPEAGPSEAAPASTDAPADDDDSVLPLRKPGEPCPGTHIVDSITALRALTPDPIWPPADHRLSRAWACGSAPFLMFGDIEVTYENGTRITDADAEKHIAGLVWDEGDRLDYIHDRPAFVGQADENTPYGSVMVIVDGVRIRAMAEAHVPVQDLVDLVAAIPAV